MSQANPLHIMRFASASRDTTNAVPPDERESIPLTEAAQRVVDLGIAAARAGRQAEALSLFDEALRIDEDNVEALLWRGGLSPANDALPYLERAIALDPSNERAREGLIWARQRLGLASVPVASAARPGRPESAPVEQSARPAQPRSASSPRPSLPALSIPDLRSLFALLLTRLVERPGMALMMSVLLLGLLATAAVARAGMSRADAAALPTPQVTAHATTVKAVKPVMSPTAQPVMATASGQAAPATTLDQAWAAEDWPQVIAILDGMIKRTPSDAQLTQKLFSAHFNYGVQLVRSERLAEAVAEFDKALAINANDADAQSEKQFAQLYLNGSTALAKGDFASAVTPLRTIYEGNPGYRAVKSRLYQAYVGYANGLEKEGKANEAFVAYRKAAAIDPQGAEAQAGMTRLKDTPAGQATAMGKKIEVSLSKQQVMVWENGKVIYTMKASTGKAPYLTRTGSFEILDKMPYAESSGLGWGMPYWMGIYFAGGTENGFHAMARLKDGSVLSTSVLGRPATSGCIMLSDYDAKILYEWAPLGTPVIIRD